MKAKKLILTMLLIGFLMPSAVLAGEDPEPSWWEQAIMDAITTFWNWLLDTLGDAVGEAIDWILASIPDNWMVDTAVLGQWLEIANVWLPVDYGLTLMGMYYGFVAVFCTVKFILKCIPTVG
jgi:hypothetical protein